MCAAGIYRGQSLTRPIEEKVELIASRIMHEASYLRMRSLSVPPRAVELFYSMLSVMFSSIDDRIVRWSEPDYIATGKETELEDDEDKIQDEATEYTIEIR